MKKKVIVGIKWSVNIVVIFLAFKLILIVFDKMTENSRIEETIKNVKEIRIALEKYYQLTGRYPELSRAGANNNLYLLDYIDENGRKISFAEIYGKKALPKTFGNRYISSSNQVYDVTDFLRGDKKGGWNYNFSENTGEIHANLPENMYREEIDWNRQ